MRPQLACPAGAAYGREAASGGPPAQPGSQSPAAENPYGEKSTKGPLPIKAAPLRGLFQESQIPSGPPSSLLKPHTHHSPLEIKKHLAHLQGEELSGSRGCMSGEAGKAEMGGEEGRDGAEVSW